MTTSHMNDDGVTWNRGLLPTGIIFLLLGIIGALFRVMLHGGDKSPLFTKDEALFWMWPGYFAAVGVACIIGSVVLKGKPAVLAGMALQKPSEVVSLTLSVAFGVGFMIALPVMATLEPLNMSSAGKVWDTLSALSGATLVGMFTTVVCGGVAGPTLVGALLSRVGLSRVLIIVVQGLIFVIGIIL